MTRERIAIAPASADAAQVEAILDRARHRGFRQFVLDASSAVTARPGEELVHRQGTELLREGRASVPIAIVSDPSELDRALARVPEGGVVALQWTGDRVIPLETAVATRGRRFEIWAYARAPGEIPGALGALEHGANRVIVEVRTPSDIDAIESIAEGPVSLTLEWASIQVASVAPAGIGDRVIVDTTSLMRPSEGFLVGSAAAFLYHVASEAVGSRFSRARPFRVNAGSAHSYLLMADGSTRYLAELAPGDSVLATQPHGPSRPVRVGRIKVERRPLVVVMGDDQGSRRTVFLQEAETVRLSGESTRISTTDLHEGASVLGVRLPAARHLGHAIEETIEER